MTEDTRHFEVRTLDKKGAGLFLKRPVKAQEVVLVFVGEISAEQTPHSLQVDTDAHLHPGERLWKYLNHSCEPNCGIKDGRELVALKEITAGEELTFDYAMTEMEMNPLSCLCGSYLCRETITGYRDLPTNLHKRYEGFISEHLLVASETIATVG